MKLYYNQDKIATNFKKFFINIFPLFKPLLNSLVFLITGMLSAESVVSSDIVRKLKDHFSSIAPESAERHFRRFFRSFSSFAYSFFEVFISFIISRFTCKHSDNKIFISLDHMFCKNKFTILLFSLRIGRDPWFLITNDNTSRAVRNYSYRFGSIECIFKSQKSNGFRLESTNTQKIEHFISLYTVMCIALVWLTIIGSDYVKNKHHYHIKIRDTRKHRDNSTSRLFSLFNLGLTIFNLCYYNSIDFILKFDFVLYDL